MVQQDQNHNSLMIARNIVDTLQEYSLITGRAGVLKRYSLPEDLGILLSAWESPIQSPGSDEIRQIYIIPQAPISDTKIFQTIQERLKDTKVFVLDLFNIVIPEGIHKLSPNDFFDFLISVSNYETFIQGDTDHRKVKRFFIDRTVKFVCNQDQLPEDQTKGFRELVDSWAIGLKKRQYTSLLVLGERGSGKTWLAMDFCQRHLPHHIANRWVEPLPIYINLRLFSEETYNETTLSNAITYHLRHKYSMRFIGGIEMWQAFVKSGRIILVMDGLDEMARAYKSEYIINHLWEVFSVIDLSTKCMLTAREAHFGRLTTVLEHFAYDRFKQTFQRTASGQKRAGIDQYEDIFMPADMRVRRNFNIWRLGRFLEDESSALREKYKEAFDTALSNGTQELESIILESALGNVQFEYKDLVRNPACHEKAILYLARRQSTSESLTLLYQRIIERAFIDYNVKSGRGIEGFVVEHANGKTSKIEFDTSIKMHLLEELAWCLVQRQQKSFTPLSLPRRLRELFGRDYEALIHDLSAQTVLKLADDQNIGGLEFMSAGVFAFFIAAHLRRSLLNPKARIKGIQELGTYDLSQNEEYLRALGFLREMILADSGALEEIFRTAEKLVRSVKPYTYSTRFLTQNLRALIGQEYSTEVNELESSDSWRLRPLDIAEDLVLMVSQRMRPFAISRTEVTNRQFKEFLSDLKFPENSWWDRSDAVSQGENPWASVINDYHLFFWGKGQFPKEKADHPVVYVSWFAAAAYCNWRSIREKKVPYYQFTKIDGKVEVNLVMDSDGYRLPSVTEWTFVAREGNYKIQYPWNKFRTELEREEAMRKLMRRQLETTPVMDGLPDSFGVFGMMGNVREWSDAKSHGVVVAGSRAPIMGSTWFLGIKSFRFGHKSHVFAENTNLDVGFRVARFLTKEEERLVA